MESIRIRRLAPVYRLPASQAREVARLDTLAKRAVADALTVALGGWGREGEEVCIRTVRVPVRLALGRSDEAVAADWGRGIVAGLLSAKDASTGVVRYGSRRAALLDFAESVAKGDLERAWAWRLLGLLSGPPPSSPQAAAVELVRALASSPGYIVGVFRAVAERGHLGALVLRLDAEAFRTLAVSALRAHGGEPGAFAEAMQRADLDKPLPGRFLSSGEAGSWADTGLVPTAAGRAPDTRAPVVGSGGEAEVLRPVSAATDAFFAKAFRIVRGSPLARALTALGRGRGSDETRCALAVLAVLDAEPRALAIDPRRAAARIEAVLQTVTAAGSTVPLFPSPPAPRGPSAPAIAANAARAVDALVRPAPDEARARRELGASADDRTPRVDDEAPWTFDLRDRGTTRAGGLLFLLHLVAELSLADALGESEILGARPLRFLLYRLALALAPVEEGDPAALAFAGLPPSAKVPSADEEPLQAAEQAAIQELADKVLARLGERLGTDEPRAALESRVLWRDAEILADPGWFEVRLRLDEVTTEVRRAGLDLHPETASWLGVVVRFSYA